MKLVILGPPGSGKGTYSSKLEDELGIEHISTGALFREAVGDDRELGRKVNGFIRKGELVPDSTVNRVVEDKLEELENGFILDGYPRTVDQTNFLLGLTELDAAVILKTHEDIAVKKLMGRRMCSNCGQKYNVANIDEEIDGIKYNLPPLKPEKDMTCDKCGGSVEKRHDDDEETIKKRFGDYEERVQKIERKLKEQTNVIEIWANSTPERVTQKILEKLN